MRVVGIDLEALETPVTQLVLRQHARDGAAEDLLGLRLHHGLEWNFFETTGVHGVVPVQLLVGLLARHGDVLGVRDDDIVAHVSGRIVHGLVLAHECDGNRAREST